MSSETKFTKGEWLLNPDGSIVDDTAASNEICFIDGGCDGITRQDLHNAHLIKTAPKLYAEIESEIEFLKELREDSHTEYQITLLDEKIADKQKLLAEARGEA